MNYARVMIGGRLTRDPEMKYLASGKAVAHFSLAVNDGWGDNEHASFIDCQAWEKTAENIVKFFHKGDALFIEGELRQESWEKDGEKRSKIGVVAEYVQFLGGKGGGERQERTDGDGSGMPF